MDAREPPAYKAAALPDELDGQQESGGPGETRTHIHLLAKQRLCQLELQAQKVLVGKQATRASMRSVAFARPCAAGVEPLASTLATSRSDRRKWRVHTN